MNSSKFFFLLGLCFFALTLIGTCIDAEEVPPHAIYKLVKRNGLTYVEKQTNAMPFNICEIKANMLNQVHRDRGGYGNIYVCFEPADIDQSLEVKK